VAKLKLFAWRGLSALCLTCLLLGSPLSRAGVFSATASAGFPDAFECIIAEPVGGSGFSSASVGPISCAGSLPSTGATYSGTASASGSWVTGDFSASVVFAGNPVGGGGDAIASDTFGDAGLVTLPSGMTSAPITFGVTGLSGGGSGGPTPSLPTGEGGWAAEDFITLNMIAGGSSGTSGTSEACVILGAFVVHGVCPDGSAALVAFSPGSLAPITLTVQNGDYLQLSVSVEAVAAANAFVAPEGANAGITVDPLFLTLPAGATFDSGIAGFLSGTSVPEPASLSLLALGLSSLVVVRRRKRETA